MINFALDYSSANCEKPLKHKTLIITEDFLIENKIYYCKVIQRPGYAIVTHPIAVGGYHSGYITQEQTSMSHNF